MYCFRFPVPDLRKPDRSQTRSWRKNLREEVCLVQCTDVAFETSLQGSDPVAKYETRFKKLMGRSS